VEFGIFVFLAVGIIGFISSSLTLTPKFGEGLIQKLQIKQVCRPPPPLTIIFNDEKNVKLFAQGNAQSNGSKDI
jgi:hypothetical protein